MRHINFVLSCALLACGCSDVGGSVTMTLTVQIVTPSQVQLTWTPYDGGGDFYAVYRNGTYVGKGDNPGLTLDAANQPHVSFRDGNGVILAVRSGDVWQYSPVDAGAGGLGDTDIRVDRNGANHLSYRDYGSDRLKVATDATGVWFTDVVNSGGNIAVLAIGSTQGCQVHYLTNPGGRWSQQLIANDSNCGAALARDMRGVIHVVYSTPFGLRHARYSGGVWQTEPLENFSCIGGDRVALAIDGTNHLHVAYRDQNFDLKYACNLAGIWEFACADSSGGVGFAPSIAVDPTGRISIVYTDQARGTVKLASNP